MVLRTKAGRVISAAVSALPPRPCPYQRARPAPVRSIARPPRPCACQRACQQSRLPAPSLAHSAYFEAGQEHLARFAHDAPDAGVEEPERLRVAEPKVALKELVLRLVGEQRVVEQRGIQPPSVRHNGQPCKQRSDEGGKRDGMARGVGNRTGMGMGMGMGESGKRERTPEHALKLARASSPPARPPLP